MNEKPATESDGRRAIATSFFGGAMLATVATASLAQVTYFVTAGSLAATPVPSGYVVLGGNSVVGDGGGGSFMPIVPAPATCTSDHGIVFPDGGSNCFIRADPTYSVREWGALCDVVAVNAAGAGTWTNGPADSAMGTLTVPTTLLSTPPNLAGGHVQFIAISQIGQPTLWANTPAAALPAVSLTRFSTLSNRGTGYSKGDLVSFAGGTFSQRAAIIVDAVGSGGTIAQWHFLWGGLYNPASGLPTGPMTQDNSHTYCGAVTSAGTITYTACGTTVASGAMLTPAWSGWSVLNSQTIINAGTNYHVGDTVTLWIGDTFVNQGHYATLVVEGTTTSGGVASFDWTDYGSFVLSTLSNTGTLTQKTSSGGGSGLTFSPVGWTQGPYASTIMSVGSVTGTGNTTIVVAGSAAFPGTIAVQSFYYGTDDSGPINFALEAMLAKALIIPAGCGTTAPLNLSQGTSTNNDVASLVGSNLESSGLYAFAFPPGLRGAVPVLGSVLYSGLTTTPGPPTFIPTSGGGFRNMLVEGFGIPEGYGYWGLAEGAGVPSGYVGPGSIITGFNIPSAGTAVELDRATFMRIDNVHVTDGGTGPGNATMQIGVTTPTPPASWASMSAPSSSPIRAWTAIRCSSPVPPTPISP